VNLGLRYEAEHGAGGPRQQTWATSIRRADWSRSVSERLAAFHGDHNNFSPRLGFAWDLSGNGKTVIRGGGSIMYEQLPFSVFTAVGNQLGLNPGPHRGEHGRLFGESVRHWKYPGYDTGFGQHGSTSMLT